MILTAIACLGAVEAGAFADEYDFNNNAGGDGTWENQAGTVWSDGGTQNLLWDNTLDNIAQFNGTAGTVDVEGSIVTQDIVFNTGGTETLNGAGNITINTSGGYPYELLSINNNTNVTIGNNLTFVTTPGSDRFNFDDNSTGSSTVTLNGNLTYSGTASNQGLIFDGGSGVNYVLGGALSDSSTGVARLLMYGSGSITLKGDYTSPTISELMELDSGTLYLSSTKLGTATIQVNGGDASTPEVLTTGAYTVANEVHASNYTFLGGTPDFASGSIVVGGNSADLSTYNSLTSTVTGFTLTAVAGGRVNVGSVSGAVPTGIVKIGAGTVNLTGANSYSINNYDTPAGTVAADIQQGTLLINNTSGSAFGNNSGVVKIEAGTTLGGSGISTQNVVGVGATSIIAPGEYGYSSAAGASIAASLGTLHLNGGLTEESGLTMDFKLSGDSSDRIDFGGANILLDGQLTINLSGTPTVDDANAGKFILLSNFGLHSTGDPTLFVVNAPAGYTVADSGVDNNIPGLGSYYYVQLAAAPEPSPWALTLGGMAAGLLFLRRRRTA